VSGPSWTLGEIATLAGGRLLHGSEHHRVEYGALSLDSRTLRPGDFFVALRGEQFDGHSCLESAAERGACAALVDAPLDRPWPQIVVDDSMAGWQRWGANHRRKWESGSIVAITGSSGKTTTKDLVAHLLAGEGSVWATEGNRNNHVGVPWTLLGLHATHRFAVIEMGMNHPGEIALLSRLTQPDVALITSVGRAHIGHLGSREAILAAKLEIESGLAPDAPLVLPADPWIIEHLPASMRNRSRRTFGLEHDADWHPEGTPQLTISGTRFSTRQTGPIQLAPLGAGAMLSALAALASVEALRADPAHLARRLADAPRHRLRMEPRHLHGMDWILDCYNASPESTRLAIEFVRTVPHLGRRVLVLGALAELGDASESIHRELGGLVHGIEIACFIGQDARPAYEACLQSSGVDLVNWSATREEASNWLAETLLPGDLVLLKAARRLALERILERFAPDFSSRMEG
jgi:UDP-N-acetylmuramoyl-tripeptide--D-alanyl-D-alanine ligase